MILEKTLGFKDSSVNENVFPAFTTDASTQTKKVAIMQHVNKISRSTQQNLSWKSWKAY